MVPMKQDEPCASKADDGIEFLKKDTVSPYKFCPIMNSGKQMHAPL